MRYTVVILTYDNRLEALQRCVEKVLAGSAASDGEFEIIVVNNGSTDDTRTWLQQVAGVTAEEGLTPVKAIHLAENEGVCARNHGLRMARGEFIIQIDDDVLVTPGFDRILLAPFLDPDVGASGQHGFYQEQTWRKLIDDRRRPQPGQYADLLMGFCWAWRNMPPPGHPYCTPRFRYDPDFNPFWHEESDFQMQIRHAGYRLAVTPEVAVHRTLHDWKETHADGPQTGITIAKRNFYRLEDKWKDKGLPFEGPRVGLRGPDLRGRTPRRDRDDFAGKAV